MPSKAADARRCVHPHSCSDLGAQPEPIYFRCLDLFIAHGLNTSSKLLPRRHREYAFS